MPRRSREPDFDAVWEALAPQDRATIEGMERTLRLPAGGWRSVPPIRDLAVTLAAVTLTQQWPSLSESDALDRALAQLGIPDDSDAATRPADILARKIREWRRGVLSPRTPKPKPR